LFSIISLGILLILVLIIKFKSDKKILITIAVIFLIFDLIVRLHHNTNIISNNSNLTGLYHDSFNNSIEFQANGIVHYNQLNRNSLSCHTIGHWIDLGNNKINITLEINPNCSFVYRYTGEWEIKDCFKLGESESGYLIKEGNLFFYKEK
jgi:c-di-AMP phosphodiesterase-like protein